MSAASITAASSPVAWHRLVPFPGMAPWPPPAGLTLEGALAWRAGALHLGMRLQGPLQELILPAPAPAPVRRDGLWQHTCLEAFWGVPGAEGYWELNASPSGDWNLYRLERYRQGLRPEPLAAPPQTLWTRTPLGGGRERLELELVVAMPSLAADGAADPTPAAGLDAGLEAALTAVLAHRDGGLSYWALAHPGQEPDFHDRRGFQLALGTGP